jgi:hypothetical protein
MIRWGGTNAALAAGSTAKSMSAKDFVKSSNHSLDVWAQRHVHQLPFMASSVYVHGG